VAKRCWFKSPCALFRVNTKCFNVVCWAAQNQLMALIKCIILSLKMLCKGFSTGFHPQAKFNDIKWLVANSLNQLAMTEFSGEQNDMTAYQESLFIYGQV
jgi:hypothetical protein